MVELDESQYPLLIATWQGETKLEDVDVYVAWVHKQIALAGARGDKIIVISDATKSEGMESRVRKHMNDQFEAFSPNELEVWLAPYLVMTNPVIRGLVKALAWMSRGSSEKIMNRVQSFGDRKSALEAARAQLAAASSKKAS